MGLKTKLLAIIGITFIFLNHNWKNDKEIKKERAPVKKITIGNRAITGLSQQYFVYHLAHFLVSLQSIIHFRFVRIISFSPSFCYYPTIFVLCITVLFKKRLSKLFSQNSHCLLITLIYVTDFRFKFLNPICPICKPNILPLFFLFFHPSTFLVWVYCRPLAKLSVSWPRLHVSAPHSSTYPKNIFFILNILKHVLVF